MAWAAYYLRLTVQQSVIIEMKKPIPEFAIFQDSKRQRSALWVKGTGKWTECDTEEFLAISVLANMLRSSSNVTETMEEIAKVIDGGS